MNLIHRTPDLLYTCTGLIIKFSSFQYYCTKSRVEHRVLFPSERSVLFRSFKERNVLFRSFIEFLATYETQKRKNVKEREERNVLLQRT